MASSGRDKTAQGEDTEDQSMLQHHMRQSGRSGTGLHAHASAASIREAERTRSQMRSSQRSRSTPDLTQHTPVGAEVQELSHPPNLGLSPHQFLSPHAPVVPSPLSRPSSGENSRDKHNSSESYEATFRRAKNAPPGQDGANLPVDNSLRIPPTPPPLRRGKTSDGLERPRMAPLQQTSFYSSTPPMSVQDLGSDYTRYFNPFSDSRRSSTIDLARTPLHPDSSATGTPTRQLSDPFLATAPNDSTFSLLTQSPTPFTPFLDDRLVAPFAGTSPHSIPMFVDEKEVDDDMHMPLDDDDVKFKPTWRDFLTRKTIVSTVGLFFMTLGLLFTFIGFPILGAAGLKILSSAYETPLDQMYGREGALEAWAYVNDVKYPLLKNIRTGLIDPSTPESAMTRQSIKGETLELVFSDEFNDNNRTFYPGDDPYWFAGDFWYGATRDLEWYDPDAVTTWDGTLELRLDEFDNHNLSYRSGMLNSWNQLCFKGGVFEVSISLPGPGGVSGLWPGAWTMGNLGRPGYLSTTEGMWPYTYQDCDYGITPNQSMDDGTSFLPGMKLPSCVCKGEDHPTPGHGRGAPEIDILEGSAWGGFPVATQSYQVAPFDIWYYPDYDFTAFPDPLKSLPNTYTGGPFQQAVSASSMLNKNWYDGFQYQKYAFEYAPGTNEEGYIAWFVGDDMTMHMDGRAIGPNGNIGSRIVSEEPMTLILNLGFSHSWVNIDWANLRFPTVMRVDYVRWYQPKGRESVTCDPKGYETTQYIADHLAAYTNPNWTQWSQTPYSWPRNTFMHDCEAE